VTGRLSCSQPNLQQVPKASDKAWNGKVKECFIAEDGFVLLNADFSQLELRLATAYAGEEALKEVFAAGRDIFTEMSVVLSEFSTIFDRQNTKTFVYSTQYGAGRTRLMNVFGVTERQAEQMLQDYYRAYPYFRKLNERCKAKVEKDLRIRIWSGRERHFQYANEGYKAMNSVIQGGSADIVERIMVRCFEELESDDCHILLQVHDSITFEVRIEKVDEYLPRIKAIMEDVSAVTAPTTFDVKFDVDAGFWTQREERIYNEKMAVSA
jgi:DNA polymerase-1